MKGTILQLATYPVKGLSAVTCDKISLRRDDGFPGDRMFGFAKGNSGFDPATPRPMPKDRFIVLLEHAELAGLHTAIDPETRAFSVRTPSGEELRFDLCTKSGRLEVSAFFERLLNLPPEEVPFFAESAPHRFTDVSVVSERMMNAVSLVNLASVEDLASKAGVAIDPARFRANILFDNWPPFSELDLVGRKISIGDVTFEVLKRTRRCAATRVNPRTATRDLDVLSLLHLHYRHLDMGIYAQSLVDGTIGVGDIISAS